MLDDRNFGKLDRELTTLEGQVLHDWKMFNDGDGGNFHWKIECFALDRNVDRQLGQLGSLDRELGQLGTFDGQIDGKLRQLGLRKLAGQFSSELTHFSGKAALSRTPDREILDHGEMLDDWDLWELNWELRAPNRQILNNGEMLDDGNIWNLNGQVESASLDVNRNVRNFNWKLWNFGTFDGEILYYRQVFDDWYVGKFDREIESTALERQIFDDGEVNLREMDGKFGAPDRDWELRKLWRLDR